jgi:release factor glutamine methyltransferase
MTNDRTELVRALARGGSLNAEAESVALVAASEGGRGSVEELVARRLDGEPLAWIVGWVEFCDVRVLIDRGVFVPRPQTEPLARRAVSVLPQAGIAVDLCTGCGAIAVVLGSARPNATVLATDADPHAVACARRNGVRAFLGDLDAPLPTSVRGRVDIVVAVVPYVPSEALHLLPSDVLRHEPRRALDGGPGGTRVLLRAAGAARELLRPGGTVLLEIGGDQAGEMTAALTEVGLLDVRVHRDEEGQDRAIEARRPS